MASRSFTVLGIALLIALAAPASASYAGDKPLTTVMADEIGGGYAFTLGNSTYSGTLEPGDTYTVAFEQTLPADARITDARAYVYWAWSRVGQQAVYPAMQVALPGVGRQELNRSQRYVDSKGFVSSNDFFSGMDVYPLPAAAVAKNPATVTVANAADDNTSFVVQGVGLLIVYESPSSPQGMLWVKEGCDMLYSSYGVQPEMATNRIEFAGAVDTSAVRSATLQLVAPSGGYTRTDVPQKNAVTVNRNTGDRLPAFIEVILEALFPGYNGREWTDAFDATEQTQVGTDTRDIAPYLRSRENIVTVRDNGDYLLLTNAFLWIDLGEEQA
ncbi:DUF3344 domain-containing protein [Methanoculleus sp. FWC-SCC1]|uniref:DUF3344 domain-containing protein n=1 Tax=Methanoculleus frigidifontis TaxID=2584085 RepID=A0ABT8M7Z1_9EURY|nr:DUF3344 domain-containing protein [Methanoculleus sp. FWC-SCC1]MDN7024053.1 DUF3344 domain-containing protein [Methanoculleus sp. FWC-SCC1]